MKFLKCEGAQMGKRQDPMAKIYWAIVYVWNVIQNRSTTNLKTGVHTQTKYCNPSAHALRVNDYFSHKLSSFGGRNIIEQSTFSLTVVLSVNVHDHMF